MIVSENIKSVEEYTREFKQDYDNLINYGNYHTQMLQIQTAPNFEIVTIYTDQTPVTASNSSILIK
jgi:hypothetical protein